MNNKTHQFIEQIQTACQEIPEHVIEKAKQALADYVAVTFAGATFLKDKLQVYLQNSCESGQYYAVGILDTTVSLKDAIFLNGLNAHALDFDDGTNQGIIHLGSPLFSVLLPLAQKYNIDSRKFLRSVILGYETSFTLAASLQPHLKEQGYHATGVCGVLGISMAMAYMLDYSQQETYNAFGAACVSATGFLSVLDNGSELKPYNVAKAVLMGYFAAQMGKMGFQSEPDPLGSSRGFLKMFADNPETEIKPARLDGTYAIEKIYTKPYAACRYCHPAIEAAILLRNQYNLSAEDVQKVSVGTYHWAVKGHDHKEVPSVASAKMSIPYGVAVGLLYGKAGLLEYQHGKLMETTILHLLNKIEVVEDEQATALFPAKTIAVVSVQLSNGKEIVQKIDFPKGEPQNPFSHAEFESRFLELMQYAEKSECVSKKLYNQIIALSGGMKEFYCKLGEV